MDLIKKYSIRSFVWIMFFMAVLLALVDSVFYLEMDAVSTNMSALIDTGIIKPEIKPLIAPESLIKDILTPYFIPVSAAVFALLGFMLWLLLRVSLVKTMEKTGDISISKETQTKKKPASVQKETKKEDNRRMFLHLLSVFQREGRLVDFFSEDLSSYEDDQIGAAVRSIHENCKKTVDKYLAPQPVMDQNEGEQVTIQPNFDPESIKLTGNVTGDPPFNGTLRHKGWKASKLNLPTLSGSKESNIIAPAEVEIT